MRQLAHPEIIWRGDGTPEAAGFGDIYFSPGEGLSESRAVFLAGCHLPEAWAGRRVFTIAETGFGTGLNFLALWQSWRDHRPSHDAFLHFVSFEAFPLKREDAERALSAYPELAFFIGQLLAVWPEPVKGTRQHVWPGGGVTLTLHLGPIAETLPRARFKADAWFLDGFSPARNPDMWSTALFHEIAAHSNPGARAATFTVAGDVRRGLEAAGFSVSKHSGHGRKRERLEAVLPGELSAYAKTRPNVAVIGAGIGGACAARALADLGASVSVFEIEDAPYPAASFNPLALIMPRLDVGETAESRLLIDAYLAALAFFRPSVHSVETDVIHRPRDDAESLRFEKLSADPLLPASHLGFTEKGLIHRRALILDPCWLIPLLLEDVEKRAVALSQIDAASKAVCGAAFDAIVLAHGMGLAANLPFASLTPRLGQVDYTDSDVLAIPSAIAAGHYAIEFAGTKLWGATFEALTDAGAKVSDAARAANRAALESLAPHWARGVDWNKVQSRASVRATTPDRLPLIGALPAWPQDNPSTEEIVPGVYVAGGFGSRGFTFAPFAARLIAAEIMGAPSPVADDVAAAADPMRFIRRARRRGAL